MARRYLHQILMECDAERRAEAEKALIALAALIDSGALKTKVTGLVLDKDIDIGDIHLLNLANEKIDPPTAEGLAAILAKLPTDSATQTTLAAVLAKLPADPTTCAQLTALIHELMGGEYDLTSLYDLLIGLLNALSDPAQAGEAEDAAAPVVAALERIATVLEGAYDAQAGALRTISAES